MYIILVISYTSNLIDLMCIILKFNINFTFRLAYLRQFILRTSLGCKESYFNIVFIGVSIFDRTLDRRQLIARKMSKEDSA